MRKIFTAFVGIGTGLLMLFTPSAQATVTADDCTRVAVADRALCASVKKQHTYGAYYGDNSAKWTVPNGKVLVYEITHQGFTKAELHASLVGTAREYRDWVTAVPVNMDAMVRKCGNHDGRWVVEYRDEDGRPGGTKLTYAHIVCA